MAAIAIFHGLAARDYRVALRWYARRSMRAAQRFKAAVDEVTQRIENAPQQGAPYLGRFRWMRVHKFPYILYYEIITPALVRILAVAHGRRRPGYWLRRTQP